MSGLSVDGVYEKPGDADVPIHANPAVTHTINGRAGRSKGEEPQRMRAATRDAYFSASATLSAFIHLSSTCRLWRISISASCSCM